MNKKDLIKTNLGLHIECIKDTINQSEHLIEILVELICRYFQNGNKVMFCGNGGSAADAQHIAGEFINRFRFNRAALPAIALTTDTSIITSIGNDSSFDEIFSRQIEAIGKPGDILVVFSTSGRSPNILKALNVAHLNGITTIGFTGLGGKDKMAPICDYCLVVSSDDTPRIQEVHEFVWHIICEAVEAQLF